MITGDVKIKIVELRAKDYSIKSIASQLGISKQTVVDTCKELKSEVATLRAVELDALYEAEAITTEARLRNLSTLLAKIRTEIDKRDLEDVPTEKLIDLYLKTSSALHEAVILPVFKSSQEQKEELEEKEALASLL